MATLAELNVVIGAQIDEFEAKMATVQQGFGRLGDAAKDAGSTLATYVTLPLGLLAGAAVAAYAKIDGLTRGLNALSQQDVARQGVTGIEAISEAATETTARLKELQDIARLPGISFEEAVKGDLRLRSVGIDAAESAKALREFSNAIAFTGGGAAQLSSVTVQLSQLSAKGKVLAQDLRPIIEAAPAVSQALIKLYGTVDSETISASLAKQGKSSQDFIAILTDELAKLPRVTGGIGNALENFQQGAVQNAAKLGESLNKAFNLEGLLASVSQAVDQLTEKFASLDPAVQKLIFGALGAAAALGPVLFAIGAIGAALPSIVAGFEVLGIASAAALGPIAIGAAAVVAIAVGIYENWDKIAPVFEKVGVSGKRLIDVLGGNAAKELAKSTIEANTLGIGVSGLGDKLRDTLSPAKLFDEAVQNNIVRPIQLGGSILSVFTDAVANGLGAALDALTFRFSKAGTEASAFIKTINDPFGALFDKISQSQAALTKGGLGAEELFDALAGANALTGGDLAAAFGPAAKTLADYKAQLKDAKDELEKEVPLTAQFNATKATIASLEALIKKYEDTGKAAIKAANDIAKAFAQIRAQVAGVDARVALGQESQYDGAIQKIKELQRGIQDVTDKGVRANDSRLIGLISQLGAAQGQLAGVFGKLRPNVASSALDFGDLVKEDIAKVQKQLDAANLKAKVEFDFTGDAVTLAKTLADNQKKAADELTKLGVPANEPGSQAITSQVKPLNTAAFETKSLKDYSDGLREIAGNAQLMGRAFDEAGERAQLIQKRMQDLLTEGVDPSNIGIVKLREEYNKAALASQNYKESQANAQNLNSALAASFEGLGQAIGSSLVDGSNAFRGIFASLIDALADYAAKRGALLIADGVADLFVPGLQGVGAGKIAAGVGLEVAAGVGHAAAGVIRSGGGGAAGSAVSSPAGANYNSSTGNSSSGIQQIELKVVLRGQDLVAVQRLNTYRSERTN